MDPQSVSQSQIDSLSDAEKRDLQQSLKNEMQKAKIQECMASLQLLLSPKSLPTLSLRCSMFAWKGC